MAQTWLARMHILPIGNNPQQPFRARSISPLTVIHQALASA